MGSDLTRQDTTIGRYQEDRYVSAMNVYMSTLNMRLLRSLALTVGLGYVGQVPCSRWSSNYAAYTQACLVRLVKTVLYSPSGRMPQSLGRRTIWV